MTVVSHRPLRIGDFKYCPQGILPGLQIRGACKQIYEETHKLFWRNRFHIPDLGAQIKTLAPTLTENLQEVSWSWWGFKIKDT